MATPIQQNLQKANAEYASSFTQGSLALPPAKKYLVRTYLSAPYFSHYHS
jgi:carbonic anhydrase